MYTLNTCIPNCAAGNDVSHNTVITANDVRMTKDGYVFSYTLIQADSPSHAQAVFQNSVTACKGLGYSGDTKGDGSWYGTKTSDTGTPQAALVMPPGSDNTVITLLGE